MKVKLRRFVWLFPLIVVSGCIDRPMRSEADVVGVTLRNAARALSAGKATDAALLSMRRGDEATTTKSLSVLRKAGGVQGEKIADKAAVDFYYGRALDLNARGFVLAEKARSVQQAERAVKLTRESLDCWDKVFGALPKGQNRDALRFERALFSHDSHAWALFKQGKLQEALREQSEAVDVARETIKAVGSGGQNGLADMLFHLGKIHAKLGNKREALEAWNEAVQLNPQHEDAKREAQEARR